MTKIDLTIYTSKQFNSQDIAEKFVELLEKYNLVPEKLGTFEPLKVAYSPDTFIQLWTDESDGCYEEGVGMVGKAGILLAKSKNPPYHFGMTWWNCPNMPKINHIGFIFAIKTFRSFEKQIVNLFKELIVYLMLYMRTSLT
ncbi:hypothetical protein FLK61_31345 [Paenalkalicoccus suaedae]|uniref:Uncharacterized protein n=1 Tax=Paenalkalicoccus suaedae TaxID=2592382 RepID=A0A859FEB1_9BACI|nr:hypothetical protein [Paenalkalicoccus suaedae]QKS71210.1 hypothetical protein FLK61_31345 [Paenalkalicoccus suaedae]